MSRIKTFIDNEVFLGSQRELLQIIINHTRDKKKKAYYAINADCMLHYWNDEAYRNIINQRENLIYVDGMGVIYAQRFLNIPTAAERIATTDLFPALMAELNERKSPFKIFLLGGKDDTAEKVRKNFSKKYPNVEFVGTYNGYFDKKEESKKIISHINDLEVDILFVGFGNPLQEKWVDEHFHLIEASTVLTCGGLFDYYSNHVKRAPIAMQKIGFEWLYRLLQEPKRLYKRYLFGNIKYILKVLTLKLVK